MEKRKKCTEPEAELIQRIKAEHDLFYYRMLSSPPKTIYDECSKIRFCEVIYEYFLYCENIPTKYVQSCLLEGEILPALYGLYLKYEELVVDTWVDVENLIERHLEEMEKKMASAYRQFGMPEIKEKKGDKHHEGSNI